MNNNIVIDDMEFIVSDVAIHCYDEDGEVLAEVTFPETSSSVYTIDHTFVDDRLRGQGIAGKLVRLAVDEIERRGGEVRATCSYAQGWLEKHGYDNVVQ